MVFFVAVSHVKSSVRSDGEIAAQAGFRAWCVPIRTVGVQGDYRSYSDLVILDGPMDLDLCGRTATLIITRNVARTNRVALLTN